MFNRDVSSSLYVYILPASYSKFFRKSYPTPVNETSKSVPFNHNSKITHSEAVVLLATIQEGKFQQISKLVIVKKNLNAIKTRSI